MSSYRFFTRHKFKAEASLATVPFGHRQTSCGAREATSRKPADDSRIVRGCRRARRSASIAVQSDANDSLP